MEYLHVITALVTLIQLFIILRLSATCRRLNAENDMLVKAIELQDHAVQIMGGVLNKIALGKEGEIDAKNN